MTLHAWKLYGAADLRYEEAALPPLKEDEVRIRVMASGICGSDVPRIFETGAYHLPLIPGHEFSGIVEGIGKETDAFWLKKRVGVYPLLFCGSCICCKRGQPQRCQSYGYLGSRNDGAFAEYVHVPKDNLILLPDTVSYEEAALLEPLAVAVHAVKRLPVYTKDRAMVIGQGTIGRLVREVLKTRGVQSICTITRKESKEALSNSLEADLVYECVGKPETAALALQSAAPGGRVVMVGNPAGTMSFAKDIWWRILRRELLVTGSWNSVFTGGQDDDWAEALTLLAEKRVSAKALITHRFPFAQLDRALSVMRDRKEPCTKVMLVREEKEEMIAPGDLPC